MLPNWLQLNSSSIASLAEFTLSLVILLYIFSLRNKSKDTWIFIGMMMIGVLYYLIAFLFYSIPQLDHILAFAHDGWLALVVLYYIYVIYGLLHNPYPKEMKLVMAIALALFSTAFYVAISNKLFVQLNLALLTFPLQIIFYCWLIVVLTRKALWFERKALADQEQEKKSILSMLRNPTHPHARLCKALIGWAFVYVVTWVNVNIMMFYYEMLPAHVELLIHHSLLLFNVTYFAIVYTHFAQERTSFQAKLIGVVLCLVLTLLGVLPFALTSTDGSSATTAQLEALAILIILSTVVILVVLPLFFRYSLLRPLNRVVVGVNQINAGDMCCKIAIEANDEFGSLSKSFNQMTASLQRYSTEMENLVAQRTAELKNSLDYLKATQAQLIHAEKMASLGELTAGIAHEIQNPLNFVNNFSEVSEELVDELKEEQRKLLSANKPEDDALEVLKQNLQKIQHHGRRADAIVKNMLQHSRQHTGEKQLADLKALADEYLRLAYHGLRAKDTGFSCTLDTSYDPKLEKVEVVSQDFGRVLLNLFNNAFYAVQQKQKLGLIGYEPKVQVSIQQQDKQVVVRVRDNGIGVPESVKSKIFQPFFTTKPSGQGTGLGLSLSYDIIIKGHGGEMKVDSVEGEYTEFEILLPANFASSAQPALLADGVSLATPASPFSLT